MTGWREVRVEDVAVVYDGPHATPVSPKTATSGPVFLGISSLKAGRLDLTQSGFLSESDFERWTRRVTPQAADVVFSYETRLGQAGIVPAGLRCALGRRLALMRPDQRVIDPRFLLYSYLGPKFQETIRRNTVAGSTVDRLMLRDFPRFPLLLPSMNEQRGIGATLGALDDKIESNRRQAILIGALFAAEFLALTNDCKTRIRLDSVATFTKGVSYRSAELTSTGDTSLVTLKSVGRHGGYQPTGLKPYIGHSKQEQVLQPRELVVAQTDLTQAADVMGRVVRVPADASGGRLVASLDLVIVRPREPMPVEFLYGVLLEERFREHCRSRSSGTTVLHLSRDALPQYQAPAVALEEQQRFAALSRPLLDKQDALGRESIRLAALRDALLPELLSGRLRVPKAATT